MKNKLIAPALLALSLAASGSAFAQRGDDGNDRHDRDNRVQQQYQQHGDRHDNGHHDRYFDARQYHRDDRRGGGPRHDLRHGQRLSAEYRSNRYVVTDWRDRHLSAPPRGHHWVRAGNDYVLAAIATGVIAQVLLSN